MHEVSALSGTAMTPAFSDYLHDRLDATDAILADETKWTKLYGGLNAGGKVVDPNDPQACKWCLYGAAYKAVRETSKGAQADLNYAELMMVFRRTLNEMGIVGITTGEYNDDNDFPTVKALIVKAHDHLLPRYASIAAGSGGTEEVS
jgi:hypothetical protein